MKSSINLFNLNWKGRFNFHYLKYSSTNLMLLIFLFSWEVKHIILFCLDHGESQSISKLHCKHYIHKIQSLAHTFTLTWFLGCSNTLALKNCHSTHLAMCSQYLFDRFQIVELLYSKQIIQNWHKDIYSMALLF